MVKTRVHAVVSGRVQGVSYRASTAAEAARLGLVGWVRNLPNGDVELEAQGDRAAVDALIAWCHRGPSFARVDRVVVSDRALADGDDFEIRR